jgi:hypothetical protein
MNYRGICEAVAIVLSRYEPIRVTANAQRN